MKPEESILLRDSVKAALNKPHPAVVWADSVTLDPAQVDCITVIMLDILDNHCKMSMEEQLALMAVYGVVRHSKGQVFDNSVHQIISRVQQNLGSDSAEQIHRLRLYAESAVPKPMMKYFKQYLRESLFGIS